MNWWHRLIHRNKMEDELEKELRFHLDLHTNDLIAKGHDPSEARRLASLSLGGREQVKEKARRARGTQWVEDLLQDLRFAARMLTKKPAFTAVAVLALGLGIGVNTAILSAVNGFVLRPLSVDKPEDLIAPRWGKKINRHVWEQFSYRNYEDLRDQNKSFSGLCAWSERSAGISSTESRQSGNEERAEVVWGELVTNNYFDVMNVKPLLGRGFSAEENRSPNANPVVVIGNQLWQRRFNSDQGILGKTIFLNGQPFSVIGVMPESFLGSMFFMRHSFWTPAMMSQKFGRRADWNSDRTYAAFKLYGRLKSDVTTAQAETDLNLIVDNLARLYPKENGDTKIQLTTELDGRYADATRVIKYGGLMAICVASLVLLLACANVANLMLARAATRAREIGIRLSIGASRGRIIRQLLTESILLSLLGGVLGWVLAYRGTALIARTIPPVPYPIALDFSPDGYVLKWMLVVSLLTGVIFGLAPALLATRTDLVATIKGAAGNARGRWNLRGALVVAQVTISIVVLICAGLFIRSLGQALKTDPGFHTENMVTMMINPRLLAYDDQATWRFFPELLRRIETQPGVRSVALTDDLPLQTGHLSRGPIVKEGESDPQPNQGINSYCSFVSPKYFDTVRTTLVQGRDFTERDNAEATPVVIVNQEFARKFYGGEQNAMGKRFRFSQGTPLLEIIGIAKDGMYDNLYEDRQIYMFLPLYQQSYAAVTLVISAQSPGTLPALTENARREIAKMDSRMPVVGVMMAEENMAIPYWGPRLAAGMASTFGVLALILSTMGLYSVMTYVVSQRTREIGIRMALGASLRDVLRLVVSQGMRMALIGGVLGLAGAFVLTRVFASLLLGVGTTDTATFAGVSILLVTVAFLACYIPARRAARVNPVVALRQD